MHTKRQTINDTTAQRAGKEMEDNDNKNIEGKNKERVLMFFETKIAVHIGLINKDWLNGNIVSLKDNFFILNERKKGEMPILYSDIYSIDKLEELNRIEDKFLGEGILPEERTGKKPRRRVEDDV